MATKNGRGFPFISNVSDFVRDTIYTRQAERARFITPWIKATPGAYKTDNNFTKYILESILQTNRNGKWPNETKYSFHQLYRPSKSYRPIPGITDVKVDFKNKFGGIRKASITWMCHTLADLEELMPYFMNPGKTLFLEWGWSPGASLIGETGLKDNTRIDLENYFDIVQEKIENSSGNYDAMLGVIVNYSYTINEDLSYNCITDIISTGALMEGLSMSNQKFSSDSNASGSQSSQQEQTVLLYIKNHLDKEISSSGVSAGFKSFAPYDSDRGTTEREDIGLYVDDNKVESKPSSESSSEQSDFTDGNKARYITWGYVEDKILSKAGPNLKIDQKKILRFNSDGVPIKNHLYLRSTDLSVCVLPNWNDWGVNPVQLFGLEFDADYSKEYYPNTYSPDSSKKAYVAFVRNILINYDYFKNQMTNTDNLFDAISGLFSGINAACGSVWDFQIITSPDSKRISVIDASFSEDTTRSNDLFKFNTRSVGVKLRKNGSSIISNSIIKSISLETKLSSEVAYNVFYSSNKGPNDNRIVNGVNDSSGKMFHREYGDSFAKYCESATETVPDEPIKTENPNTTETTAMKQYDDADKSYTDNLKKFLPVYSKDNQDKKYWYEQGMKNLMMQSPDANSPSHIVDAIVPVNLNLKIEGVSGLKIGDIFTTDVLPKKYDDSGVFQIVGLKESISRESWDTEIKAMFRIYSDVKGVLSNKVTVDSKQNTGAIQEVDRSGDQTLHTLLSKVKSTIGHDDVFNVMEPLFNKYKINTRNRIAEFLAQAETESTNFTKTAEVMNYTTPERIVKVFSPHITKLSDAEQYVKEPRKLGNRVYGDRKNSGNRGCETDDGYNYRGHGYIQVTGRDAFLKYFKYVNVNPETIPDDYFKKSPERNMDISCYYWTVYKNLNKLADAGQTGEIITRVAGNKELRQNKVNARNKYFKKMA